MKTVGSLSFFILIALLLPGCSALDESGTKKPNGESLFQNNCARCHGYDAMGSDVGTDTAPAIQGRSVDDLRNAIDTVPEMEFLRQNNFTDAQLQAISDYLLDLLLVTGRLYEGTSLYGRAYSNGPLSHQPITVKDSSGILYQAQTDARGYFTFAAGGLQTPYMIQLTQTADGKTLYAYHTVAGLSNISPLTDMQVRDADPSTSPSLVFEQCSSDTNCFTGLGSNALESARRSMSVYFASALAAAGLSPDSFDPAHQTLADNDQQVRLIDILETTRVMDCSNPMNPRGYRYDDDENGDCYADSDLNYDGIRNN